MEDIKELLSTITGGILTHTRRQANITAHRIARWGFSMSNAYKWDDQPPTLISDLLIEESVMP